MNNPQKLFLDSKKIEKSTKIFLSIFELFSTDSGIFGGAEKDCLKNLGPQIFRNARKIKNKIPIVKKDASPPLLHMHHPPGMVNVIRITLLNEITK
jgi:hypothetical protein